MTLRVTAYGPRTNRVRLEGKLCDGTGIEEIVLVPAKLHSPVSSLCRYGSIHEIE